MIHMGDDISLKDLNPVLNSYPDKECPDCGEPLPEVVQEGDACCQCGHVFYTERKDD
jgi:uncharacterized Zn finger protein (UPF0148 family)